MTKKYTGVLIEPLQKSKYLAGMLTSKEEANELYHRDLGERVDALFKHYNIKPGENEWVALAIALAQEHVPGFKFEKAKKPGRSKTWSGQLGTSIFIKTQIKLLESNKSLRWSVLAAAKDLGLNLDTETKKNAIYARYHELKKINSTVEFLKDVIAEIDKDTIGTDDRIMIYKRMHKSFVKNTETIK